MVLASMPIWRIAFSISASRPKKTAEDGGCTSSSTHCWRTVEISGLREQTQAGPRSRYYFRKNDRRTSYETKDYCDSREQEGAEACSARGPQDARVPR